MKISAKLPKTLCVLGLILSGSAGLRVLAQDAQPDIVAPNPAPNPIAAPAPVTAPPVTAPPVVMPPAGPQPQSVTELLAKADALYAEKSYAEALPLYRQAKAAGPVADLDGVNFRIANALFETQSWDEAFDAIQYGLANSPWKARLNYLLARYYLAVPHQGYKVGDKLYRGQDYPTVAGAEKPVQVWVQEEDAAAALVAFETAKVESQSERTQPAVNGVSGALPSDQEIDLNLDLAAYLPQREIQAFLDALDAGKETEETEDLKAPYDPTWSLPRKALYLYDEVPTLDNSPTKHQTALALLAKGMFIQGYRQRLEQWSWKYDEVQKKQVQRPYPYQALEPVPVWRQVVDQFPADPIADKTLYLIAQTQEQQNDLVKALATYDELAAKYPKSKWVSDCKAARQRITRREVSFSWDDVLKPGVSPVLSVNSLNSAQVAFTAYNIKLDDWLLRPAALNNSNTGFTSWTSNLNTLSATEKSLGAPVAHWTWTTGDKGDYQAVQGTVTAPFSGIGAYLVEATVPGVRFARILVISDLAILKKTDRNHCFCFVADAKSGTPIQGANVVIKENYWQGNSNHVSIASGVSDDGGFFDKPLTTGNGIYNNTLSAFAYVGNRFALTGQQSFYWNYGDNRGELRILPYTDRPVYRPGQKVYFRQLLSQRVEGGDWKPVVGTKVQVTVTSPKGDAVYTGSLTTGEFGSINGSFDLPVGAPLGEYNVDAEVAASQSNIAASGANRFRVEEYKRPEYEVTVVPPANPPRPGDTVSALIKAKYYFGAPVQNATVKYTIRRSVWWADYHFPEPFDWLYQYWGAGDYDTGRRNIGGEGSGTIVKQGTAQTDNAGIAEVDFPTTALDDTTSQNDWYRLYANPLYTVEAEVTDASRRTIESQGEVKVAGQQYFAFLKNSSDYYLQGDHVPVELHTQDANDQPVAATGQMVVYRELPDDKEEKVFTDAVQTDKDGRCFWSYQATDAGQFRVAYEATDGWGKPVKASLDVWIAGPGFDSAKTRLQGVTILLDKRDYAEGDSIHALLIADQPGTTVLFTQESGGEIFQRNVYFIEGKSREVVIPVTHRDVPNFFLAAAAVKDFQVYQTQQEVFVPPVRQMINLQLTGDKSVYKPGETGTFTLKATDYAGQPVRGEFSIGMIDASLFYIQKDYAPDIRQFFYADRRDDSTNLDSFRSGDFENFSQNDTQPRNYEQHGWELPDDMGLLNLQPGQFGFWGFGGIRHMYLKAGAMSGELQDRAVGGFGGNGMAMDAVPMAAGAPMPMMAAKQAEQSERQLGAAVGGEAGGGGAAPAPEIRTNFAETAFWSPAVVTGNGTATVQVTFPDSLTQWHATARGVSATEQVGSAETDATTTKDLLVRLQAPRFFVQRDQVVISANVQNNTKETQKVHVVLSVSAPLALTADPKLLDTLAQGHNFPGPEGDVEVGPNSEERVNWCVDVQDAGTANLQVTAQGFTDSDGVKMSFPVLTHGVQRFAAQGGVIRGDVGTGTATALINLPKERRWGSSRLDVQLNPSLAATMLDALPYLGDYPYGCVEQTLSRFLPAVVARRTLKEAGINFGELKARAQAYAAESSEAPIGDQVANTGYTYPKGLPGGRDISEMASTMWHTDRWSGPVFDEKSLDGMISDGLTRLTAMQRDDGGWGWWPGSSQSDEYMSAYVVYGLATAKSAGVDVPADVLAKGNAYLAAHILTEDNLHLLAAMTYSLSVSEPLPDGVKSLVSGRLFEQRARLSPYSQSLLAMALWNSGDKDKAAVLVRNLENTIKIDPDNGTAHWAETGEWWWWWNDDDCTNATALRAFLLIDPTSPLTGKIMKRLVLNARGNHWSSTRSTAEVVYALADYVRVNHELDVDYTLKVTLNGNLTRTYHVTRDNALFFDNRFTTGDFFLQDGNNTLTIEKQGKGNVYWNAYSEYFSLEEPIQASGNEISITRRYFKLTPNPAAVEGAANQSAPSPPPGPMPMLGGRPRLGGVMMLPRIIIPQPQPQAPPPPEFIRTEIHDGDTLQSGDLVEVELTLNSKNDYSYLVFEDMKPAGLEPVDVRSGEGWGDGLCSNVELRDEKVAFFVDYLPQGQRVLRYQARAEVPGKFHALPANGYAMYAPEVRAISNEMRLGVHD